MAETLRFPLRLAPDGSIQTILIDTEDDVEQLLATAVLTVRGERNMHPDFGCTSPLFAGVSKSQVAATVARYGPTVTVETITSMPGSSRGSVEIAIGYKVA